MHNNLSDVSAMSFVTYRTPLSCKTSLKGDSSHEQSHPFPLSVTFECFEAVSTKHGRTGGHSNVGCIHCMWQRVTEHRIQKFIEIIWFVYSSSGFLTVQLNFQIPVYCDSKASF